MSQTRGAGRYAALDGARGLAALLVLCHHLELFGFGTGFLQHGYLAVDVFFVLSGFVMAAAYEKRLAQDLHPVRFMLEIRAVRLYPMLVLALVIAETNNLLGWMPTRLWRTSIVDSLLFIPNFAAGHGEVYPLNNMQWSLLFEVIANIAHAFFLRRLGAKGLFVVAGLGALGLLGCAAQNHTLNRGNGIETIWWGLARVGFAYPAGIIIYRLLKAERLPRLTTDWRVQAIIMFGAILLPFQTGTTVGAVQDLFCVLVIFPAVVMAAARSQLSGLVGSMSAWLGDLSYPVYMIQGPLFYTASYWAAHNPQLRVHIYVLSGVATLAGSALALRFYDEPLRRHIRKVLALPKAPANTAP